ncbi:DUF4231 domain-containing protein [Adhaeribacter soli]|uniref:DUF4231 domain-containing protein n=1 Tax=Adhaeribacter soli TaxID=2607655 RepID=A0A5N1JA87_9BACT|nr:DUF4231 domain-containing protein [Adhaeribacter soli]KAA9345759.1 DUF4231 domain-containing protein [Adhaeribacter soli]
MELKDFPGLYQASDKASLDSQSTYKNIIAFDLITMIIAASLAVYNYQSIQPKLITYTISGLFLLIGLILTLIIRTKKYEDIWYQGRALAESCKTLTWRFITCSESFEIALEDEKAKEVFVKRIKDLSSEFKDLNENLNAKVITLPVVTDKMMEIRRLNMLERKQYYVKNRIEDQRNWYAEKAEFNKLRYNRWFILIISCQAISLICVAFLIKYPGSNWNLVGFFTTVSASALSWLQLKQHQELKQAYTTAAQELNFILVSFGRVNTEEKLSEFVLDSENAISREHTLWCAQRR